VPEEAEPSKRPSEVTRLLFKAVKGLSEDEQRAVFEYFFERGIGIPQPPFFGRFIQEGVQLHGEGQHSPWHEPGALATLFTAQAPMGPAQITIPVRLSEAQHRRLKDWCAEHHFPMAVVVRGLIERFLESWQERPA
jgi:hypothetical protein